MLTHESLNATPIHLVPQADCTAWCAQQIPTHQAWLTAQRFAGELHKVVLLPTAQGKVAAVILGLGKYAVQGPHSLWHGAALPERLPEGAYYLATDLTAHDNALFALGWEYGQYRFDRYRKKTSRSEWILQVPVTLDVAEINRLQAGCSLARDLINTPACDLTPDVLAQQAIAVAQRYRATYRHYVGEELLVHGFPAVHAVGRAASVSPQLIDFTFGEAQSPRVTLVGKGVCFDSGGLDIKPSASMLLMKKDMGGAACVLGLAQLIMEANLPIQLRVIIPAVENAIAGNAFRPGDVLTTRAGLNVEVGNTDAEGRLILCDALALADSEAPELLIDMATLTGAARVALGPEIPALFTADDALATTVLAQSVAVADPMWRLPLWAGYDDELNSKVADLNNVSNSGFAGAIIGGLFLQRFVRQARQWMHIDLYAWNTKDQPGRPVGAEAQCIRALFAYLKTRFG